LPDAVHAADDLYRVRKTGQKVLAFAQALVGIDVIRQGKRPNRGPCVDTGRQIRETAVFDGAQLMHANACST
jgi:hypothetical protein